MPHHKIRTDNIVVYSFSFLGKSFYSFSFSPRTRTLPVYLFDVAPSQSTESLDNRRIVEPSLENRIPKLSRRSRRSTQFSRSLAKSAGFFAFSLFRFSFIRHYFLVPTFRQKFSCFVYRHVPYEKEEEERKKISNSSALVMLAERGLKKRSEKGGRKFSCFLLSLSLSLCTHVVSLFLLSSKKVFSERIFRFASLIL